MCQHSSLWRRCIRNTIPVLLATLATFPLGTRAAATVDASTAVTGLIVRFNRDTGFGLDPTSAIAVVQQAAQGKPADFSTYSRLSSPLSARWLIEHRLPPDYIEELRQENPDHPELYLQEYVVLRYGTPALRSVAEKAFAGDPGVVSVARNSPMTFSATATDYFIATGHRKFRTLDISGISKLSMQ